MRLRFAGLCWFCSSCLVVVGCRTQHRAEARRMLERKGDEIMVAGQYFHTGARRSCCGPIRAGTTRTARNGGSCRGRRRRFEETAKEAAENKQRKRDGTSVDSPNRYGIRFAVHPRRARKAPPSRRGGTPVAPAVRPGRPTEGGTKLTQEEFEKVRGGGWPLELLQQKVDQFVYHYDVAASSRGCFRTLHDHRGPERPLHAGPRRHDLPDAGREGARLAGERVEQPLGRHRDLPTSARTAGQQSARRWRPITAKTTRAARSSSRRLREETRMRTPELRRPAVRTTSRSSATCRATTYTMYDLTPQQYDSLIKLTAALCTLLPQHHAGLPARRAGEADHQGARRRAVGEVLTA